MTSSPQQATADVGNASIARRRTVGTRIWTRKLHNYLGLYLLLFVWLFSVSGLLLNHSAWSISQSWKTRRESVATRSIRPPRTDGDVAIAMDLMRQLAIVGELGATKRAPTAGIFEFQATRPGRIVRVQAQIDSGYARITDTRLNGWGAMTALHEFSGVKMDDPTRTRHWILTRVWSLAMDALSLGLLMLVATGLFLWYRLADKRRQGVVALLVGAGCCGFFVYGIALLR
ncbi:MAG: hypothetical protein NVS1B4_07220 [Gemmatimonadaceae bacterium]